MTLAICCVEAGNYLGRGPEYVRNLQAAVACSTKIKHDFIVFTEPGGERRYEPRDWPVHAPSNIGAFMVRPLPMGTDANLGWFYKLGLFSTGLFMPRQRVLYFDLDTLITGPIDELCAYDGEFAMLEDLFFAEGMAGVGEIASGVMAWRSGVGFNLYDEYVAAGCPLVPGGDQVWIAQQFAKTGYQPDRLQDLYPNQIVSYKVCKGVLTANARVVCFHGTPRPHEITSGWVPQIWRPDNAGSRS